MFRISKPKRPFHPRLRNPSKSSSAEKPREEIVFGLGESSLGHVLIATSARGVVTASIGRDPDRLIEELEERFPKARLVQEDRDCARPLALVIEAIEKPGRPLELPLDLRGTAFQVLVWNAVRKVTTGQTSTYSEIAAAIGKPKAIRAVGTACANSSMALLVPCHRILHKDGSLSQGCFWGDDGQRILLDREAAAAHAPSPAKSRAKKRRAA